MSITSAAQEIIDELSEVEAQDRLELLLEYANSLPQLPPQYVDHPDALERVEECQSPVFLFVEVEAGRIKVYLTAPEEAPTTRAFANILYRSLNNQTVESIQDFDNDFPERLGLTTLVSPLRMRGIRGMLTRIKRQSLEKSARIH